MRSKVNPYPLHPGKMDSVTFPERVKALIAAGKSKRAVADRLGVSHTQLARYLEGQQPTLDRAADIADRLGLTLDELAGRAPDRSRKPRVVAIDGVLYQPISEPRAERPDASSSPAPDTDDAGDPNRAAREVARGASARRRQGKGDDRRHRTLEQREPPRS